MATMTDDACVSAYVRMVHNCWVACYKNRLGSVAERVSMLALAVKTVHRLCNVCPVLDFGDTQNINPDVNAYFDPVRWVINLNQLKIGNPASVREFIDLTETLYHEARHVEQCWLIARVAMYAVERIDSGQSRDPEAAQKRESLVRHVSGFPKEVTSKVWNERNLFQGLGPDLTAKVRGWYDSMFVNSFNHDQTVRGIDNNPFYDLATKNNLRQEAYFKYRYSAHEADAFDIQLLVRSKLALMLGVNIMPKEEALSITSPMFINLPTPGTYLSPILTPPRPDGPSGLIWDSVFGKSAAVAAPAVPWVGKPPRPDGPNGLIWDRVYGQPMAAAQRRFNRLASDDLIVF